MKRSILYFILLIPVSVPAQSLPKEIDDLPIQEVKLEPESSDLSYKINLSNFSLLDARDDSSDIGYLAHAEIPKRYLFKAGFTETLSNWFSKYLNSNPNNKTGMSLFANIRKLRFSKQLTPKRNINGHKGQPNNGWEKGVIIKIEFFLERDSLFTPLYRYDSAVSIIQSYPYDVVDLFSAALIGSVSKLLTMNLDSAIASKKKIHFSDILASNKRRYELPVLQPKSFNKGVYKTFEEFKMNNPSIKEFQLKKGQMGDILFVKEDGKEYPARDVWGYCDGKDAYINSGDKYYSLLRVGNTFCFRGMKSIKRGKVFDVVNSSGFSYATGTDTRYTTFKKESMYFQVDMENGEVY